jgi:hypothetical protein
MRKAPTVRAPINDGLSYDFSESLTRFTRHGNRKLA